MKTTINELPLTPKQQLFCDEYLVDMNATAAAIRAGYSKTTALNGQLMTLPKVKIYLKSRTEQVSGKLKVTHEMVMDELRKIAFADMGAYFGVDGRIKPLHEVDADARAAIHHFSVKEDERGGTFTIKLNNKLTALEKIIKLLGLYDMEELPAEKEYVYVDKDNLDDDDMLDDDSFDEDDDDDEPEDGDRKPDVGDQKAEDSDNGEMRDEDLRTFAQAWKKYGNRYDGNAKLMEFIEREKAGTLGVKLGVDWEPKEEVEDSGSGE